MQAFIAAWRRGLAAGLVVAFAAPPPAMAQDGAPSAQEMVEALKPRTRSLRNLIVSETPPDANAGAGANAAASAPAGAPAAGTAGAAAGPVAVATDPPAAAPSLSMAIRFDFDSARLRPEGAAVLDRLATALQTDALKDSRFLIEGHTDAKGGIDYNQRLSQLRADEVRRYLMAHGLAAQRLSAVGKGAQEPANPAEPGAAVNRRVRIVNLE